MSSLHRKSRLSRRDLFRRGGQLGISAAALSGMAGCPNLFDGNGTGNGNGAGNQGGREVPVKPTDGDIAILRFLAAAEILETDLWNQYCELANGNAAYQDALKSVDDDMPSYICDNTADERSHADFLNAYLASVGAQPVDLEPFRTLMPPAVTGLEAKPRLTNLTSLNVDTSWIERYMGSGNPDFGDSFDQVVTIQNRAAIPVANTLSADQVLAAAYVASFHFGSIEQGGTSLYPNMLTRTSSIEAVQIVAAIGPTEAWHLTIWRETIGGVGALDAGGGLIFPDLTTDEDIHEHPMPNPCRFFNANLPLCSVVRPTLIANAGAKAAATFLTNSGLFKGQSPAFFDALNTLATAADAAVRT